YVDSINRRMGTVMVEMADELKNSWDSNSEDNWLDETLSMSRELDSAWQTVRLARESERHNPRKIIRHRQSGKQEVSYEEILDRIEEGISHLRNLIRTIREASCQVDSWDEQFRSGWGQIVNDVGLAIADPQGDVSPQVDRLHNLSDQMSASDDLPDIEWPLYGGLITSLHNIMVIVDDVASAVRPAKPMALRHEPNSWDRCPAPTHWRARSAGRYLGRWPFPHRWAPRPPQWRNQVLRSIGIVRCIPYSGHDHIPHLALRADRALWRETVPSSPRYPR